MGSSRQFVLLKDQWQKRQTNLQHKLWKHHGDAIEAVRTFPQHMLVGSLASLILFTNQGGHNALAQLMPQTENHTEVAHTQEDLVAQLSHLLPSDVRKLTVEEDSKIGALLTDYFKMPVWAVMGGKQLNRTYGYIGAEQHLMRFPGDVVENMAPGRGGFGYFAEDGVLTQKAIDREKYYIAVQTFLSPGWGTDRELVNFFKFRKMLVVNPDNGNAMVVVIGDSGPAEFTGKHLGGSPEVMQYLKRVDGAQKGPVLYYFIDDPEDTVPLGPITVK